MTKKLFKEMNMTEGNLFAKIGLFALPLFLATVLQLLYSTVDLVTVHFMGGGQSSMAAVAANGALINLVIVVFANMSMGSNVAMGNAKGAGEHDKAKKILHTSFLVSIISGIAVGIIGFFTSMLLLELMKTDAHIIDLATTYLKIYFLGMPFLMIYNYLSQIMRAIGNSSTPFFILLISGIFNVVADIAFVAWFKMDVAGVAIATVISEVISALLSTLYFFIDKSSYVVFKWKEMRIDKGALKEIVRLGLPAGLQGFFFALPNVFIQAKLYTIAPDNPDLQDGAIAAGNIESYIYAGIEAIFAATMSFTAQNYGAKKIKNINKIYGYSLIWNFMFCAVVALVIIFANRSLLGLFVDTEQAFASGKERLMVIGLTYCLDGIMDITSSTIRGCRRSMFPMITTLIGCTVVRIILLETVFNIPYFHTVGWLYSVYPITWIITATANIIAMVIILKKVKLEFGEKTQPLSQN